MLYNLGGTGPFLDPNEALSLSAVLLSAIQSDDKDLTKRANIRLLNEYGKMTPGSRAAVRSAAEAFDDAKTLATLSKRETQIKP
jgi:hypothetical protein